jgi:hypothetical protein
LTTGGAAGVAAAGASSIVAIAAQNVTAGFLVIRAPARGSDRLARAVPVGQESGTSDRRILADDDLTVTVDFSVDGAHAEAVIDGRQALSWDSSATDLAADDDNFAMFAALPIAMRRREPLHVRGAQYRRRCATVPITADAVLEEETRGTGSVICLSGEVASAFAYLAVPQDACEVERADVRLGVFVQGFDFGLDDDAGFGAVLSAVERLTVGSPRQVTAVRTNWNQEVCGSGGAGWDEVHALGLAPCRTSSAPRCGPGSSAPTMLCRGSCRRPWGCNAATHRMLGCSGIEIVPVGEHMSRLEQIAAIARIGDVSHPKVCWAGPRDGSNRGVCEKCQRTMLMFETIGLGPRMMNRVRQALRRVRDIVSLSAGHRPRCCAAWGWPNRTDLLGRVTDRRGKLFKNACRARPQAVPRDGRGRGVLPRDRARRAGERQRDADDSHRHARRCRGA